MTDDWANRWWPCETAPERIQYLANARNMAIEPLQSENSTIRLPDYESYDKVLFINDILFSYQGIIRLLATDLEGDESRPPNYDLACAMDFGSSGEDCHFQ